MRLGSRNTRHGSGSTKVQLVESWADGSATDDLDADSALRGGLSNSHKHALDSANRDSSMEAHLTLDDA